MAHNFTNTLCFGFLYMIEWNFAMESGHVLTKDFFEYQNTASLLSFCLD